jgi:hypothetical protein
VNALPRFPDLPGLSWPVKKTPLAGATRTVKAASGRMARMALWRYPLFEFELTFDALCSSDQRPSLYAYSAQMLEGFFLQMQGSYGVFAFEDKTSSYQEGAALGIGDGATTTFAAARNVGAYAGPADYVLNVAAVYVNGVAVANWSLSLPSSIVFASPPASRAVITMDFWWAYMCTFADDQAEFDQIMFDIWQAQSLKLRSVRPS